MKTVTIYDVIQSELINDGHNEFVNDGKLTFFDNEFSFMQKVLQYDEPVHDIVTRFFFNGLTLANDLDDKHFKRAFLLHFMERQINKQTIENFSAQLSYVFMMNQDYLNRVYQDLDKYLTGHSENENQSQVTGSSDNRNASATLPQDTVNLDVNDETITEIVNLVYSGAPYIKASHLFDPEEQIYHMNNDNIAHNFVELKREYQNKISELNNMLGMNALAVEKASGVSDSEAKGNRAYSTTNANIYLDGRNQGLEKLNKRFPDVNIMAMYDDEVASEFGKIAYSDDKEGNNENSNDL